MSSSAAAGASGSATAACTPAGDFSGGAARRAAGGAAAAVTRALRARLHVRAAVQLGAMAAFTRAGQRLIHQRVPLWADRDHACTTHRRQRIARYRRSYETGSWHPAPRLRPGSSPAALRVAIPHSRSRHRSSPTTRSFASDSVGNEGPRRRAARYQIAKPKTPRMLERLSSERPAHKGQSPCEQFPEVVLEGAFTRDASWRSHPP
jgi:hypothetical protein